MLKNRKKEIVRSIAVVTTTIAMLAASCVYALAGSEQEYDVNCSPEVVYETEAQTAMALSLEIGQAQAEPKLAETPREVSVYIDGVRYGGEAFITSSTTYVGIRYFSMVAGANSVDWDTATKTAYVSAAGVNISVRYGSGYMEANGRYLWLDNAVIIRDGTMFVPVRSICRVFGYNVGWSDGTKTVTLTKAREPISDGSTYYDSDSVYWLSRIIHAEANGEPLRGKIAVGNVILNRVSSGQYPGTIYGVIFDNKHGVQFTPSANGAINCQPSRDSIIAAKMCLDGANVAGNALFFVNEAIASNSWVSNNRDYLMTIGNHKFFT